MKIFPSADGAFVWPRRNPRLMPVETRSTEMQRRHFKSGFWIFNQRLLASSPAFQGRRRGIFVEPQSKQNSSPIGAVYSNDVAPTELLKNKFHELQRFRTCGAGRFNNPPHREGESFAVPLKIRATGFAGHSSAKPKTCDRCSFSWGEKVRLRADLKTIPLPPLHSVGIKKTALVSEGRLLGLNLIYLTGVVCVCVFACGSGGVGVGRVAEQVPPAGGKLSDEAGQFDGLEEFDGANQPGSSGSSDEVPLE